MEVSLGSLINDAAIIQQNTNSRHARRLKQMKDQKSKLVTNEPVIQESEELTANRIDQLLESVSFSFQEFKSRTSFFEVKVSDNELSELVEIERTQTNTVKSFIPLKNGLSSRQKAAANLTSSYKMALDSFLPSIKSPKVIDEIKEELVEDSEHTLVSTLNHEDKSVKSCDLSEYEWDSKSPITS